MDIFGAHWRDHAGRIAGNWNRLVSPEDLVLVPGDLSWGMRLEEAEEDLEWLERLPGTKVLIKGNHDYWWPSISRLRQRLEGGSVRPLQYDSVALGPVAVGGTRLWTFPELEFTFRDPLADTPPDPSPPGGSPGVPGPLQAQDEKIFVRELARLESSLRTLDERCRLRIAMTHFPPTSETGKETAVTRLLERYRTDLCVFGHLHSLDLPGGRTWDFVRRGIRYVLVSCDAVGFSPHLLIEV
jgi:hypothetical protein